MVEVIKKGSIKKIECSDCGSLLRYDANEDIQRKEEPRIGKSGTFTKEFIKCPECGCELVIGAMTR